MLTLEAMKSIDKRIEDVLRGSGVVGCSLAITDRDGIVYSRGFGMRNIERGESANGDTVYRAASIVKVVTGLLTMRLSEDGLIDIDRTVKSYLPWFTLKDKAAEQSITLRQLLSHTSGLPREYTPEGPLDEGMLVPCLMEGLPELDLVPIAEGRNLYSNWGIRLLSAVIETVMGEKYSTLARRYILDPLGMSHSGYFRTAEMEENLAMPHEIAETGNPVMQKSIKENYARLATGGLYSTANDLTAICRLLLRGGVSDSGERIVSAESVAAMMSERTAFPDGDRYGMTLQIHNAEDLVLFGHYGSAPPYSAAMFVCPECGIGAAVLINTPPTPMRAKICDAAILEAAKKLKGDN